MGLDNLDFLARVLDRTNNKMQRTRTASSKMDVSSDSSAAVHVAFSAAGHQQPGSTGETWTMKGGRRSGRYMVGPTGSVRIRPLNSSSRNSIESTGQRMLRLMGAGWHIYIIIIIYRLYTTMPGNVSFLTHRGYGLGRLNLSSRILDLGYWGWVQGINLGVVLIS